MAKKCPMCGSKDLEGWVAGGQKGFVCATCGHDQTTDFDDTTSQNPFGGF